MLVCACPALAQTVTQREGLTLADTIKQLTSTVAAAPVGDALQFATALEVATAPFGTSSAGFAFTLDPNTGLEARTATTFGPAFAERAVMSGEGKISVAANFSFASYDKLGKIPLDEMMLARSESSNPMLRRTGFGSMVISARTMIINGVIGATDNLDVAVAVPIVSLKVDGITWVEDGLGNVILQSVGGGDSSGLGDIALTGKFRFLKFGEGLPDPGGLAVLSTVRLPTGDSDNLRGLGITRTLASIVFSAGRGRFRPHANAGYEWWSEGKQVVTDFRGERTVTARDQVQYAVGLEIEAAPKLTLALDFLGRHVFHGGKVGYVTETPANPAITSIQFAAATGSGIRKLILAPGLKWNLKGKLLLSLNALVPVSDSGLHDNFTPVVGADWTF